MISPVRSYHSLLAGYAATSANSELPSRKASDAVPRVTDQVKLPGDGAGRSPASTAEKSLTVASSVVYEPTSLLLDLSGTGEIQGAKNPPPREAVAGAYEQTPPAPPPGNEMLSIEPVFHTFETIV